MRHTIAEGILPSCGRLHNIAVALHATGKYFGQGEGQGLPDPTLKWMIMRRLLLYRAVFCCAEMASVTQERNSCRCYNHVSPTAICRLLSIDVEVGE